SEEEELLAELGRAGETEVALRGGRRWRARLELREHNREAASFTADPAGTYLVTGGLGALGLRVACWLAAAGAGRLILVSRRGTAGLDDESRRALVTIEAAGARVEVVAAD